MKTHEAHFTATQSCCPSCGYGPLDGSTELDFDGGSKNLGPQKGDISLCLKCADILCYNEEVGKIGMVIKKMDQTEFDLLDEDVKQNVFKAQTQIKRYHEFVKDKK
jgi:hypothetical protein